MCRAYLLSPFLLLFRLSMTLFVRYFLTISSIALVLGSSSCRDDASGKASSDGQTKSSKNQDDSSKVHTNPNNHKTTPNNNPDGEKPDPQKPEQKKQFFSPTR